MAVFYLLKARTWLKSLIQIIANSSSNIKITASRSVTDHFERSIRLEYYSGKQTLGSYDETPDGISAGDLQSLELPDGSRISYQYDNLQNLTTV